jgi:hypothetical protein
MISLLELKKRIKNALSGINKRANVKINMIEIAIKVLNENAAVHEIYEMFSKYSD